MERPTVFLSSTIYDFRDLRSAIKDYLELRGCRVLASDHNDFTKPLDQHSYDACLKAIEEADIFLLLIGSRVGGYADSINRISITRQEYRHAYARALEGKLRLVSFVRADVWTYREAAKELQQYLAETSMLEKEDREAIARAPSKFMSDAQTINAFINEVSKNVETAVAAAGRGSFPIANWLHQFSGFREIRQVLDPLILGGLSAQSAAERKALQSQLLVLLQAMLVKTKGGPALPRELIRSLVSRVGLKAGNLLGVITIAKKDWGTFVALMLMIGNDRADVAPFAAALASPLLLRYDEHEGRFQTTEAYEALTQLVRAIREFELSRVDLGVSKILLEGKKGTKPDGSVAIAASLVATPLHMLLRWAQVCGLAVALAYYLEGAELDIPTPMPRSPLVDQEAELEGEEISMAELRAFLGFGNSDAAPDRDGSV